MTHPECVSVVIPCYKQAHFLGEAIESVLAQTHPHYEVIIVDDGSPDETAEVASRYPDVRYVRQENRGVSAARNSGLRHSRGAYVVFLDADDRLLPHHFETSLTVFLERSELVLVCGDFRWFGEEGTWHRHTCSDQPDSYAAMLRVGFIATPSVAMVKRDAIIAIGGFPEGLPSGEDRYCWLRLARTYPLQCHHQIIAEYRRHPEQASRNWKVMLETGMYVMRSQRPFIDGNADYEEAYHIGVQQYQNTCGPPLVWQMVADARAGRWRSALKVLLTVLRFYPKGLLMLVQHKMRRLSTAQE
jgi:glycosyltransferase involved in cell wall biosynthesis